MNRNQVRKEIVDALVDHSMYVLFLTRGVLLTTQIRYGSPRKDSTLNVIVNTFSENIDLHIYRRNPICICKYPRLSQNQ